MRARFFAFVLTSLAASCGSAPPKSDAGSDAGGTPPASDAGTDAGGGIDGLLTQAEREAVAAQVEFEIDQMNVIVTAASGEAIHHTLVIRPPFPWNFFTNDMLCKVSEEFPDGCRSGTSTFNPNFAFDRFDPEVTYAYTWAGEVGTLAGTASFELTGTPTSWLDGRPELDPNDDALIVIREHVESVTVDQQAENVFAFTREATKDFDIIRADEPIRLRHTDSTMAIAENLGEGARNVLSVMLAITFTDLRDTDVVAEVAIDQDGDVTGEVRSGDRVLCTISGAPFAPEPTPLAFEWAGSPAQPDLEGCVPACEARVCGREPGCGGECGACEGTCSPAGACEGS